MADKKEKKQKSKKGSTESKKKEVRGPGNWDI